MRRRRHAAVFAGVLLGHVGLAVAWLSTHPPARFVEPATMQLELIRPPERRQPPPKTPAPSRTAAQALTAPPSATRPPAAEPTPSPLDLTAPKVLDVPRMTDQELLQRAGPRPDIAKVFEEQARQPMFSRALGRNPENMQFTDCKPFTEHSRRIAPPCPIRKTPGPALPPTRPPPPIPGPRDGSFAEEAHAKEVIRDYKERYGPPGPPSAADFPGLRCTLLHKC